MLSVTLGIRLFLAAGLLLATAMTASAQSTRRVALIIGNSEYRNATPLRNPKNDATDIAQALRGLGFDVILGRDLDKRAMEEKIREFGRRLEGAGVGLFYYAGHGLQVSGKNYLVPIDAKLDRPADLNFETFDVNLVLAQMESEKRVNLVFLDACRDNPLARSLARGLGTRSAAIGRGLASIQSAIGTLIAYATQPDNVALDGDGRNSPFTTAFLKHVSTPGLEISTFMKRVRADVVRSTREKQVPWDHSSLLGDVYLLPAKATPPATAAAPVAPSAKSGAAPSSQMEIVYWNSVKDSDNIAQLRSYLAQFPQGMFAPLADIKIRGLENKAKSGQQQLASRPPAREAVRQPRPSVQGEDCNNSSDGVTKYCASSKLDPQFGNRYGVNNLNDDNPGSAWVEGKPGNGVGEWIVVEFSGRRQVTSLVIHNGYQKNADIYAKNGRVRRLRLVFSGGESQTITLKDRWGGQTITLSRAVDSEWVQLVIDDVYAGSRYSDTAISELRINSAPTQ
jgi:uncharacterized caspase-like protein